MATTFDAPVLLAEVGAGRFRIYRGTGLPPGVPLKAPKDLPPYYQISGPYDVYYRLSPPESELSREEVLAWLAKIQRLGCEVKPGDFNRESLRR